MDGMNEPAIGIEPAMLDRLAEVAVLGVWRTVGPLYWGVEKPVLLVCAGSPCICPAICPPMCAQIGPLDASLGQDHVRLGPVEIHRELMTAAAR